MIFPRRTSRWGLVEQRTRCCSTSCCTELTFKGIALGWGMVVFSFFSFSFHSLPYLSDLFLRGCTSDRCIQNDLAVRSTLRCDGLCLGPAHLCHASSSHQERNTS